MTLLWGVVAFRVEGLWADGTKPDFRPTFTTFIDTLLPADSQSPAASELGVVESLHQAAMESRGRRLLFQNGCRWLDDQAGGDFTALTDEQRHRIVEWMAKASRTQGPRVFYDRVRHDAITAYYAQPSAWDGLRLSHPPQPRGYGDELLALERADG